MKAKSVIAALLLLVAGLQTSWAQERGMKIWRNGHFSGYTISNIDSIQFVVLATEVVLSQDEVTLEIGDSTKLTATVYPEEASKLLKWSSSFPEIASVSVDGVVKGHNNGSCTITCTAVDGNNVYAECLIKVGNWEPKEITCAEAVELANALADGGTSTETYSITGYITEVLGNVSMNQQTFWIADTKDGGRVFEAYWANLPESVTEFKAGMKVVITGQLFKYVRNGNVIPEMKNAGVVILEEGSDDGNQGGGDDTKPTTELVNGGFEEWVSDTEATGWKSASSASTAELEKSTEARSGSYACIVKAPGTANKRLATQEITLAAGSYTFSFYAKATTADACQSRGGYVPVTDGVVTTYRYGGFVNINNTEWTLVSYEFELTEETTVCLVVMNPKNSNYSVSQDVLIDDAELIKK